MFHSFRKLRYTLLTDSNIHSKQTLCPKIFFEEVCREKSEISFLMFRRLSQNLTQSDTFFGVRGQYVGNIRMKNENHDFDAAILRVMLLYVLLNMFILRHHIHVHH